MDRWRRGNPLDPRDVEFVDYECDLTDLAPLRGHRFDLFIAQHVIEEIEEPERALQQIHAVLKPGGIALLDVPFDRELLVSERFDDERFGNRWRFGQDIVSLVRAAIGPTSIVPITVGERPAWIFEATRSP